MSDSFFDYGDRCMCRRRQSIPVDTARSLDFRGFALELSRPRTFLGDGGSTLLGFICASHIAWSFYPDFFRCSLLRTGLNLLFIGGIPVFDTLSVMFRRILSGNSPFLPDRKHAHHRLQDAGLSKLSALVVLALFHIVILTIGFRLLGIKLVSYIP